MSKESVVFESHLVAFRDSDKSVLVASDERTALFLPNSIEIMTEHGLVVIDDDGVHLRALPG